MLHLARRFRHCEQGGAAEFALILPLMLLFFIGIMDAGRFLYEVNRGEKATQTGARMAVVTAPVASGLATQNYVGQVVGGVTLNQGDRIPEGALTSVSCNSTTCTSFGYSSAAFTNLLTRMQQIMPSIQAGNLIVEYSDSGLGYAGNPNGMDISPLVTVRLTGLTFAPTLLFGGQITMPDFAYTLTMEDGQGTGSN
jgi:hypothetical protein